jgi:hypothetical protein
MFHFFKLKKKVSLSEQLSELRKIGICLNEGITEKDLLDEFDREEFEEEPYCLLLVAMGGEVELVEEMPQMIYDI